MVVQELIEALQGIVKADKKSADFEVHVWDTDFDEWAPIQCVGYNPATNLVKLYTDHET